MNLIELILLLLSLVISLLLLTIQIIESTNYYEKNNCQFLDPNRNQDFEFASNENCCCEGPICNYSCDYNPIDWAHIESHTVLLDDSNDEYFTFFRAEFTCPEYPFGLDKTDVERSAWNILFIGLQVSKAFQQYVEYKDISGEYDVYPLVQPCLMLQSANCGSTVEKLPYCSERFFFYNSAFFKKVFPDGRHYQIDSAFVDDYMFHEPWFPDQPINYYNHCGNEMILKAEPGDRIVMQVRMGIDHPSCSIANQCDKWWRRRSYNHTDSMTTWKQDPHSNDAFYDFTNYLFSEDDLTQHCLISMWDKNNPLKHKVIKNKSQ